MIIQLLPKQAGISQYSLKTFLLRKGNHSLLLLLYSSFILFWRFFYSILEESETFDLVFFSIQQELPRKMTRYLIILALVTVVLAAEKYSSKYDDVDVDKILRNDRVLTNYIRCMLDEGSCTAEGRELKSKYIPICIRVYYLFIRHK